MREWNASHHSAAYARRVAARRSARADAEARALAAGDPGALDRRDDRQVDIIEAAHGDLDGWDADGMDPDIVARLRATLPPRLEAPRARAGR